MGTWAQVWLTPSHWLLWASAGTHGGMWLSLKKADSCKEHRASRNAHSAHSVHEHSGGRRGLIGPRWAQERVSCAVLRGGTPDFLPECHPCSCCSILRCLLWKTFAQIGFQAGMRLVFSCFGSAGWVGGCWELLRRNRKLLVFSWIHHDLQMAQQTDNHSLKRWRKISGYENPIMITFKDLSFQHSKEKVCLGHGS